MRISAVINTLDEELNIEDCIRSLSGFADEVIVADMRSSDRTAALAASLGAIVKPVARRHFVDPARNEAISFASGDWVLLLDADERLTPALAASLKRLAASGGCDVVEVLFETRMFGREIKYSGWQHTPRKAFFRRGFVVFPDDEVHAHPSHKGRLVSLPPSGGRMLHLSYRNIGQFVRKMNAYTDGEALKMRRAGWRPTPLKGVYWGLRHFLRRYLLKQGWRDGGYGFVLCALMGIYWFLAFCKGWELTRGGTDGR